MTAPTAKRLPLAPQRGKQRNGKKVKQDHRSLGEPAEADRRPIDEPRRPGAFAPSLGAPSVDRADQTKERRRAHQRVEIGERGIERETAAAGEQQRREPARGQLLGPQTPREAGGEADRNESGERRDEPRPGLGHAEYRPAEMDEPEQQRRLVAVRIAVQGRDDEISVAPHLPGDRKITQLVGRKRRPQRQRHGHHSRPDEDRERQQRRVRPRLD